MPRERVIHPPRLCINPECGIEFTPRHGLRLFCTDTCYNAVHHPIQPPRVKDDPVKAALAEGQRMKGFKRALKKA